MKQFAPAFAVLLLAASSAACDMGSVHPEPKRSPTSTSPVASAAPAPSTNAERFGAPIESSAQKVALADVAKNPDSFTGKTFATTGTVTAVCQHRGCWMEIKDDAGEAHIKMAGHAFFVPKTANGRKAKVLATLVKAENQDACGDGEHHAGTGKGCKAEAEAQLGRPLAKLELVAQGVELL